MNAAAGVFRTVGALFVAAVVLNYPWEMARSFLFAPMGSIAQATWRCFVASLGDGLLVLAIFIAGWLAYRRATWFQRWSAGTIAFAIVLGAVTGAAVEWWGLNTGRWQYEPSMPLVPGVELGLVPLLQMPVLTLLTLWVTDAVVNRFGS
ncbi:MAG: hypothetical protein ABS36_12530 [Acidobacteria bacterium SCN 69-37]|nr:MAG: hypothetical protein ABS36_12530 [Acidobacteria bacterium SCN 69-37]